MRIRRLIPILVIVLALGLAASVAAAAPDTTDWHPLHRAAAPLFLVIFLGGPIVFLAAWGAALGVLTLGARSAWRLVRRGSRDPAHAVAGGVALPVLASGAGPVLAVGYFITVVLAVRLWQFAATRPRPRPRVVPVVLMALVALTTLPSLPRVASHVAVLFPVEIPDPPTRIARPPYGTRDRAALFRFPDAESCLARGGDWAIDYGKVGTAPEAEACLYRVLKAAGGIEAAREVLEAQGFRVSRAGLSPEEPFVERDGHLRVSALWSIREKGPRFPERGLLARYVRALPYAMSVDATYTPDGRECLAVRVGFSTL